MGGALALDAAWLFAALLLILVLLASGIAARRFLLERGGGTVDCGLRRPAGEGAWRLGLASSQGDRLCWYRLFGVLLRPRVELERRTLSVSSRREATLAESASLGPGMVVVECKAGEDGEPGRARDVRGGPDRLPVLARGRPARFVHGPDRLTPPRRAPRLPHPGPRRTLGPLGVGQAAQRSPPGFQSTSPRSALTVRPRMNSRSDRRFRYRAASGSPSRRAGDRRPGAPFGPAGDDPRGVQQGRDGRAAGQHEAAQHRKVRVVAVARLFQGVDVARVDPQRRIGRRFVGDRVGQVGAHVEQPVWIRDSSSAMPGSGRPMASATPMAQLASSTSA